MSLTYGFYNSLNNDRRYDATQLSSIFDGLIKDGVFASIGSAFVVSADTGLSVKVGTGRAWFNRTWTLNDAPLVLTAEQSEMLLNRIDAVVLEVNSEESVRANSIKIVKGTPASSPTTPSMISTESVHQYPLCYIYIAAGVTEIKQENITNAVGTTECPFVTGILSAISTDELLMQWKNEFDNWFDVIKNQLTEDAAGNLQTQMTAHVNNKNNPHGVKFEQIMGESGLTATVAELNHMKGVTENVQTQLNGKAPSSHGTHVSYGSTPPADGAGSPGSATTVARSDHQHPSDPSKAPAYTYGNTDLTAGTSPLATGKVHFVYE